MYLMTARRHSNGNGERIAHVSRQQLFWNPIGRECRKSSSLPALCSISIRLRERTAYFSPQESAQTNDMQHHHFLLPSHLEKQTIHMEPALCIKNRSLYFAFNSIVDKLHESMNHSKDTCARALAKVGLECFNHSVSSKKKKEPCGIKQSLVYSDLQSAIGELLQSIVKG